MAPTHQAVLQQEHRGWEVCSELEGIKPNNVMYEHNIVIRVM